jgi:hypothetical protein
MSETTPFLDADSRLHQLYAYWEKKRGTLAMPARRDIEPMDLVPLLPHVMMVDVEEGPRYRYRLFGTAVSEAFGSDPTGKYIDEVMVGNYKAFLLGLYNDLTASKKPIYSTSIYGGRREGQLWTQRLMLPLSSNGHDVDKVMAIQVFMHGSPLKTLTVRLAQDKAEPIENITNPLG